MQHYITFAVCGIGYMSPLNLLGDGVAHEHGYRDGPDTARHRCDPAGHFLDTFGVDVADDHRLAIRPGDLIDADVDDGRAGLHHGGVEELRLADGNEHRV